MATKKLMELLGQFGEVKITDTTTSHRGNGDVVNHTYIDFTRNDRRFKMGIENKDDEMLSIRFEHMILDESNDDVGLLNLTKSIVSFIDDLDKIKIDNKLFWSIFIKAMDNQFDLPARNVVWDLCNEFIQHFPELEKEEELQAKFVELYETKIP